MTREEFIKQRCEIDKITEEEFEKRYRVVKCNCGQPYCKGYRCLDLNDLLEENQELKKQLEDISEELELVRCDLHNRTSERDSYERELNECLSQQKEFIKYLEDEIELYKNNIQNFSKDYEKCFLLINILKINKTKVQEILKKYKSIIGDDKE